MNRNKHRASSLRLLIGAYGGGYGAPAMKSFLGKLREGHFDLDDSMCSNLLCDKKDFDDDISTQIEKALGLPSGWLDADHKNRIQASPKDIDLLQRIRSLPAETRDSLEHIIIQLGGVVK